MTMQIKIVKTETVIFDGKKVLRCTLETGQHFYNTTLNKNLLNGQFKITKRD